MASVFAARPGFAGAVMIHHTVYIQTGGPVAPDLTEALTLKDVQNTRLDSKHSGTEQLFYDYLVTGLSYSPGSMQVGSENTEIRRE